MKGIASVVVLLALLIGAAAIIYFGMRKKRHCTLAMNGIVMAVDEEPIPDAEDGSCSYTPIVRYAVAGFDFTERADVASLHKDEYLVGQIIEIRVNPDNPHEFVIPGKSRSISIGLVMLLAAGLVLGAYFLVYLCQQ